MRTSLVSLCTRRRRRLGCRAAACVLGLVLAVAAHAQDLEKDPSWTKTLAVPPGSSLPKEPPPEQPVVRLFQLTDTRMVSGQFFVAGSGYVKLKSGQTILAGMNRSRDPYIELTIVQTDTPLFQDCQKLLVQDSLAERAVEVTGKGQFTSMPGVAGRSLGIIRLESVTSCALVPRY